jgi:TubC N-terminal docking domain
VTVQALIAEAERGGIVLAPAGDRLRIKAPAGALTPELRAEFAARKPELLQVLTRLGGMHRNEGKVPVPCAVFEAKGGPGRCFSCGEPLEHPGAYGRCAPCGLAAELFHAERSRTGDEARVA